MVRTRSTEIVRRDRAFPSSLAVDRAVPRTLLSRSTLPFHPFGSLCYATVHHSALFAQVSDRDFLILSGLLPFTCPLSSGRAKLGKQNHSQKNEEVAVVSHAALTKGGHFFPISSNFLFVHFFPFPPSHFPLGASRHAARSFRGAAHTRKSSPSRTTPHGHFGDHAHRLAS